MTKEIAHLPGASCTQLLEVLRSLGWEFEHPISSEITGWSNQGEEIILISPEEAFAFLAAAVGHGVQLWAAPDKDLFLSCGETLQIYFDGFAPEESASLQSALRARGLELDVGCDGG
ncbi:hypothetical protein EH244_30455 [Variovorax beijingensis]|uniref:Uncharacterized protein n=1 Tax=Variovorax beijingensis TaxID=2496117 RepID=A0A3P3E1V2_9BURK|nr:hypothetical protein [Variovorax beijingensis]RRH80473.1 hypothetical protein EH244_30455 [Variovorax beijingensis]